MAMHDMTDQQLAPFFAAARDDASAAAFTLGDDFLARLAADADAMQPAAPVAMPAQTQRKPWRLWQFAAGLGGMPAFSALAMAVGVGFWLGFAPPALVAQSLPLWPGDSASIGFYDAGEILSLLEDE